MSNFLLNSELLVKWRHYYLKDGFDIKYPTKFYMPLNKETKTKLAKF